MHTELTAHGPLGNRNLRRQFGLGAVIGPSSERGVRVRLIDTSSERIDDALSQAVTITCGQADASDQGDDPATRRYRLEGVLRWGAQGAQETVRFDWNQGTVIRPVAGGMILDCEMLPAFPDAAVGANALASVTAHAGYGAIGDECTALLTRYGVYDGVGLGVVFPIPPFASRVTWYPWSLGLPAGQWIDAAGNLVVSTNQALRTGYGEGLVPNAYALRLIPAPSPEVLVVWQLSI